MFTVNVIFFSRWCGKIQCVYVCSQVEVLYIDDAPLSYLQTDMIMSGENNGKNIT